jgi:hypothetical protein
MMMSFETTGCSNTGRQMKYLLPLAETNESCRASSTHILELLWTSNPQSRNISQPFWSRPEVLQPAAGQISVEQLSLGVSMINRCHLSSWTEQTSLLSEQLQADVPTEWNNFGHSKWLRPELRSTQWVLGYAGLVYSFQSPKRSKVAHTNPCMRRLIWLALLYSLHLTTRLLSGKWNLHFNIIPVLRSSKIKRSLSWLRLTSICRPMNASESKNRE